MAEDVGGIELWYSAPDGVVARPCVECASYRPVPAYKAELCEMSRVELPETDVVHGLVKVRRSTCVAMRAMTGLCGPDGLGWQPRKKMKFEEAAPVKRGLLAKLRATLYRFAP